MERKIIRRHGDLIVYRQAFDAAMEIFQVTKRFPVEERYSLTDQIRRSSRSICANLAEAWRRRRYPAAFTAKLGECESEAAETQVWLEFAERSGYLEKKRMENLTMVYDHIIARLVTMLMRPEVWSLKGSITPSLRPPLSPSSTTNGRRS